MDIIISNTSGVPIYEQIEEQIKSQIMTGSLVAGEALPSMRVLAKELKISIITTKRAYEDLERDGYIESVTGKGSFVKAVNSDIVKENMMFEIQELLDKAYRSRCGDRIRRLYQGDIGEYRGDHSAADCALIADLGYWTNYDRDWTDRLFRASGLYRKKWERAGYRDGTFRRAWRGRTPYCAHAGSGR
jgi:GntR family transcriptional regulator